MIDIQTSKRLSGIGEYYFSRKLKEIERLNQSGNKVINLGIGSPDLPPHPDVIRVLQEESSRRDVHGYQSYRGAPTLRNAISEWYASWYQVQLDPATEILPLIGSKEGLVHIAMTYFEEGDAVWIPNPGYPTYQPAVALAGATAIPYELNAASGWQIDVEELNRQLAHHPQKPKAVILNYPHMPTGTLGDEKKLQALIDWAIEHNLLLIHDNPYSFTGTETPQSLLRFNKAKDCVIELNSLSKSHNLAGWRVGMLLGAASRIDEVLRFKSNMDSGMFLPVQLAAARALSLGADWYQSLNQVYAERRKKVEELLAFTGCDVAPQQAGLFVWAAIPSTYEDGYAMSDELLHEARVFLTPGGIFGSAGEKYIRVSLCAPVETIENAIERIKQTNLV